MYDFEMELILKEKLENNKIVIRDDIILDIDDYIIKNQNNFLDKYGKTIDIDKALSMSIATRMKKLIVTSYCVPYLTGQSTMLKNAYENDDIKMIVSRDIIRKETEKYCEYDFGFVIRRNIRITKRFYVDLILYSKSAELMIGLQGLIRAKYFYKTLKKMIGINKDGNKIETVDIEPIIQDFRFNIDRKMSHYDSFDYGYDTLVIHNPSISNDSIRELLGVPKPYYCKTSKTRKESIISKKGGILYKIFRR